MQTGNKMVVESGYFIYQGVLSPLASNPAVEELKTGLWLVHGHHVATSIQTHEGEVARGLDLSNCLTLVLLINDLKILELGSGILFVATPFKSISPGLVAKPVANEVSITSIDQYWDFFEKARNELVEWFHPVAVEKEVAVDVKVAGVKVVDFSSNSLLNLGFIEVFANELKTRVAQAAILTIGADIVDIFTGALVRAQKSIVTIDRSRNTSPSALAVVASLNHGLAASQSVVHRLASTLVNNGRVATVTAGHWSVVSILGVAISQAVTDQDRLEVDVTLLVGQNFRSKGRNVMASIRLSSNVEVLGSIFGELLEEKSEKGVNVLGSSAGFANGATAVGKPDIDGLVEEDNRGIGVPRVRIVDGLDLLSDGARSELEEQAGQGRAAGSTVQPKNDRVVLGVIS
jgi:hypothetical protein